MGKETAHLFRDVRYIYELQLAEEELRIFNIPYDTDRTHRIFYIEPNEEFIERTAYIETVGNIHTKYKYISDINISPLFYNYLLHWLYYNVNKSHPQAIRAILNIIQAQHGETILDPFVGGGTTIVEANLLGIDGIGIDISPLYILQSKVKTRSIEVIDEIKKVTINCNRQIRPQIKDLDENVANFYLMIHYLSLYESKRFGRDYEHYFNNNVKKATTVLDRFKELDIKLGKNTFIEADSRSIPLPDNSVNHVVTSIPYSLGSKPYEYDKLIEQEAGLDIDLLNSLAVASKTVPNIMKSFIEDLEIVCSEIVRVVKPGGKIVIHIGIARDTRRSFDAVQKVIELLNQLNINLINEIPIINPNKYIGTKYEKFLIFQS